MPTKQTRKTRVKSEVKSQSNMIDKAVDLIKWVDTPWKLFSVIILTLLFFSAYFVWDSRQAILNVITNNSKVVKIREVEKLIPVVENLQRDTDATTVIVYKASLTVNTRTVLLSFSDKGRSKEIDDSVSSMFSADPSRNAAIVAMLNNEVFCSELIPSGKSSEWESKQGVKFVCRGSIPPEMGVFEGYITVGFKTEPKDLATVKTKIHLAATEMVYK